MKSILAFILLLLSTTIINAQKPCSDPLYRQFDFWIGDWEAFGPAGKKAGDSKISLQLDSCVIMEEWSSANVMRGLRFAGKSFNRYNAATKQWQQSWVDNTGGNTEYTGWYENNKMILTTKPFSFSKDTMAIRRMSFFNLSPNKVRQLGEISKDDGKTWLVEFDLEYRRKS
jgi:hypothetical protein